MFAVVLYNKIDTVNVIILFIILDLCKFYSDCAIYFSIGAAKWRCVIYPHNF